MSKIALAVLQAMRHHEVKAIAQAVKERDESIRMLTNNEARRRAEEIVQEFEEKMETLSERGRKVLIADIADVIAQAIKERGVQLVRNHERVIIMAAEALRAPGEK